MSRNYSNDVASRQPRSRQATIRARLNQHEYLITDSSGTAQTAHNPGTGAYARGEFVPVEWDNSAGQWMLPRRAEEAAAASSRMLVAFSQYQNIYAWADGNASFAYVVEWVAEWNSFGGLYPAPEPTGSVGGTPSTRPGPLSWHPTERKLLSPVAFEDFTVGSPPTVAIIYDFTSAPFGSPLQYSSISADSDGLPDSRLATAAWRSATQFLVSEFYNVPSGGYRGVDRVGYAAGVATEIAVDARNGGLAGDGSRGLAISPDGQWQLAVSSTGRYIEVWDIAGNALVDSHDLGSSLLHNPGTPGARYADVLHFSRDGLYVVANLNASPYVLALPFDTATGALGTPLSNPATLPLAATVGCAFNQAGTRVYMTQDTSAGDMPVIGYAWSAGWGAKLTDPANLPTLPFTFSTTGSAALGCDIAPDDSALVCGAIVPSQGALYAYELDDDGQFGALHEFFFENADKIHPAYPRFAPVYA